MKLKISLIIIGVLYLFCIGCAPDNVKHLNGVTVQDEHGRLYRLKHGIGDNFGIEPLGSNVVWREK